MENTALYYNVIVDGKTAYNGKTYSMDNFSENNWVIEKNEFYRDNVVASRTEQHHGLHFGPFLPQQLTPILWV
jgi:hypothetical protein